MLRRMKSARPPTLSSPQAFLIAWIRSPESFSARRSSSRLVRVSRGGSRRRLNGTAERSIPPWVNVVRPGSISTVSSATSGGRRSVRSR